MKSKNHTKYDSLEKREEHNEAPGASQGPVARSDPQEWGLEGHSSSPAQLRSPSSDPTPLQCFPGDTPTSSPAVQLQFWNGEPAQVLCSSNFSPHSHHWDAIPDQEPTGGVLLELLCPIFFMEKQEIAVKLHKAAAALQSSLLNTTMAKGEIFPNPHLQLNPHFFF